MPCRDDGYPPDNSAAKELSMLRAVMCGVLSNQEMMYGPEAVAGLRIDFKEAGVKQDELEKWWREHKLQDSRRRAREAEDRRLASLRTSALAKLSTDELDALATIHDLSKLKKP